MSYILYICTEIVGGKDRGRRSPILLLISMISQEKIESLIADKLNSGDYFIVSLDVSSTNKIKLVVDSMEGISIDDCVEFSRAIEHNLDREEEDFELEVTSPGLSSSLIVKEQYLKNIGRNLKIRLEDNTTIKGELLKVGDEGIHVTESKRVKVEGKKKKQLVTEEHNIVFADIASAKIEIKF